MEPVLCTQIDIATSSTPGAAQVKFFSPLAITTGNLPVISVSLVNFPTSRGSYVFSSMLNIPSIGSFFSPLNASGDPSGFNTGAGNGDGFITGATPIPATCTFDSLQVSATTGGGPNFPYTFTLWKNDVATSMTCGLSTDSGTNTITCSDTTHTVPVVPGDLVAMQVVQTGFTCCTPFGNFGISLHCK